MSVQLHYIYEEDLVKRKSWNFTPMKYDPNSQLWEVRIEKRGDSGTIYYWVSALDGSDYDNYSSEQNPEKVSYSAPLSPNYVPCLIGFFIGFVLFELLMRYGPIKRMLRRDVQYEKEQDEISEERPPES